jgi:hypothetical protein
LIASGSATPRESPNPIKVAIVEDDRHIREGLGTLIDGTAGYRCTGMGDYPNTATCCSMEISPDGRKTMAISMDWPNRNETWVLEKLPPYDRETLDLKVMLPRGSI